MKSSSIIPQEIGGSFIDDKTQINNNLCFHWKVDLTEVKHGS